MLNFEQFLEIRENAEIPAELPRLLQALLLDATGDWDGAHRIAQSDYSKEGAWIHAYLHRVEGDLGNASYWYRNAGRSMPQTSLQEEWEQIARSLVDTDREN